MTEQVNEFDTFCSTLIIHAKVTLFVIIRIFIMEDY